MRILTSMAAVAVIFAGLPGADPAAGGDRHHWHGDRAGAAIFGFAAGAILGSALAAPYGYRYEYGYPGYYAQRYYYPPPVHYYPRPVYRYAPAVVPYPRGYYYGQSRYYHDPAWGH
jgi:hypothetical protein